MNVTIHDPPRRFSPAPGVELADCARIDLAPGEQVTFAAGDPGDPGPGNDVVRTAWGYYATGSLNVRLPNAGLRPYLVRNTQGRAYLVLIADGRMRDFDRYCRDQGLRVIASLADDGVLDAIEAGRAGCLSPDGTSAP